MNDLGIHKSTERYQTLSSLLIYEFLLEDKEKDHFKTSANLFLRDEEFKEKDVVRLLNNISSSLKILEKNGEIDKVKLASFKDDEKSLKDDINELKEDIEYLTLKTEDNPNDEITLERLRKKRISKNEKEIKREEITNQIKKIENDVSFYSLKEVSKEYLEATLKVQEDFSKIKKLNFNFSKIYFNMDNFKSYLLVVLNDLFKLDFLEYNGIIHFIAKKLFNQMSLVKMKYTTITDVTVLRNPSKNQRPGYLYTDVNQNHVINPKTNEPVNFQDIVDELFSIGTKDELIDEFKKSIIQ